MTPQNFQKSLQAYQRRKPFRSFRVHFVDGEYIDVEHPEALIQRAGVAVYFDKSGVPTLFDHEGVAEIVGETKRRTS